ncbi:MAG: outer membrane protein assembly factor BamD [Myxococcales bacterium]|nr:outer membrane protein assembly factor BamD [Myxococcales bacterium]
MKCLSGRVALGLALLVGAAAVGCEINPTAASPASLTYTEDAHKAYLEALEAFEDRNWEDARALFSEVRKIFAASPYAKLAELRGADCDFEQGKYKEAIAGYRGYVRGHRGDPNIEYARYRTTKALFLDISDSVFQPSAEERDQGNTEDAYHELLSFKKRYPRSSYRVDAEYMLEVVTQRLVRHQLYVARYYLGSGDFDATVARCDYALQKFPGSGLDAEALVLKGETLLKLKKRDEAKKAFEVVVRDHGGAFGQVAKRFLDQMASAAAEPAPAEPAP